MNVYDFAVIVLLGLALFKLVDVLEDIAPQLTKFHSLVMVAIAVAAAFAVDYSMFARFGIELREAWMGTAATGLVVAGTTSAWRALFHWLGSSEGDEPEVRHPLSRPRIAA
jgi:hypothetical protein